MDEDEAERVLTTVWNGLSATYNQYQAWVFETRAAELVKRAQIEEGASVLDLGTGTGVAAFAAQGRVGPNGKVVAIDTSGALLQAAKDEARRRGIGNVEFKQTSMTSLELPDDSFDHVIGNYALCCSTNYETTLREAHRLLRLGGSITYNHEGLHPHPILTVYNDLLAKYKVRKPSVRVSEFREANTLVEEGWARFKDPFVALNALEDAGFRNVTASIHFEQLEYPSLKAYLDYKMMGSVELAAMKPEDREEFRRELTDSLGPFLTDEGLVLKQEVLTLHGSK